MVSGMATPPLDRTLRSDAVTDPPSAHAQTAHFPSVIAGPGHDDMRRFCGTGAGPLPSWTVAGHFNQDIVNADGSRDVSAATPTDFVTVATNNSISAFRQRLHARQDLIEDRLGDA